MLYSDNGFSLSGDKSISNNKEEMERIKRANVCQSCHQETPTIFWEKVKQKWGEAKNSKTHHDILKDLLRKGTVE